MMGANGVRIAEAELVELRGCEFEVVVVGLVGDEEDGLGGFAQDAGQLVVGGEDAGLGVDDEADGVGLGHGEANLLLDGDGVGPFKLFAEHAAGVDDAKDATTPFGGVVVAIAGGAGRVLDDRLATTDDAVKEGRLANVGAPDDGDQGESATRFGIRGRADHWSLSSEESSSCSTGVAVISTVTVSGWTETSSLPRMKPTRIGSSCEP